MGDVQASQWVVDLLTCIGAVIGFLAISSLVVFWILLEYDVHKKRIRTMQLEQERIKEETHLIILKQHFLGDKRDELIKEMVNSDE